MEPAPSLADLLRRLSQSPDDQHAWTGLYRKLWPFVFAINFRLLRGQRELAEDVSQEVFLRLRRYCPFRRLEGPEDLRAYTATVCRNTCRSYLKRSWGRDELALDEILDEGALEVWTSPDFEKQVEADDLLRNLFASLNPEDRSLLRLILDGYGIGEIAQRAGLNYSTAGVRVHRLRRKLSDLLGKNGPGPM